jgi:hypothetical protein
MSMIKIFNIDGDVVSEAWIGDDSPMPDGWHRDVNSAMNANAAKAKPAKAARKGKGKAVEVEVEVEGEE